MQRAADVSPLIAALTQTENQGIDILAGLRLNSSRANNKLIWATSHPTTQKSSPVCLDVLGLSSAHCFVTPNTCSALFL